jgi:hypothetical protein
MWSLGSKFKMQFNVIIKILRLSVASEWSSLSNIFTCFMFLSIITDQIRPVNATIFSPVS